MQRETDSKKLQGTLDDLRRRLKEERHEAETMTHNLSAQREQGRVAEDSRVRRLEAELAAAHLQLADQREEAARLAQQAAADRREMQLRAQRFEEELAMLESRLSDEHLAAEKMVTAIQLNANDCTTKGLPSLAEFNHIQSELDEARRQCADLSADRDATLQKLKEAESWGRALEEEETRLRAEIEAQRGRLEAQISELATDREEARANLAEVEGRTKALEEEFVAAQEKSREQREAAREVIGQLEAERDENRNRLTELEARSQWLEEELAAAQRQLREAGLPAGDLPTTGVQQNDLYWRLTVPLTLVMVSTDLLALNSHTTPQMRDAVRAIQMESRRMLESLRHRGLAPAVNAEMSDDAQHSAAN
jgi:chromosome segregation ATPase